MDTVVLDVRLATMRAGAAWDRGGPAQAVALRDGAVAWIGPAAATPRARQVVQGGGRWMTPGLIDCHTHLVHAGQRAHEFELRLAGATYEEIARAGGGIAATVAATRAASAEALVAEALPRLRALVAEGVTTVEIKSGYGLDNATELRMLRVARRLGTLLPVTIRTTLLALHALPPEFASAPDAYVDRVCAELVPAAAREGLADAVDAFCERIAFTCAQVERVFGAAAAHGLPVKLHAEQLSNMQGAALVARHHGLSADHLEHVDEAGVVALARAGTVAVLLPGAFFFLRETAVPPVDLLREHGVPIAIASDNNPGTSPYASLLLMVNMACTLFRLSPEEALAGVTREAARALGMAGTHGTIELGKRADLVLWDVHDPVELAYSFGAHRPAAVFRGGVLLAGARLA